MKSLGIVKILMIGLLWTQAYVQAQNTCSSCQPNPNATVSHLADSVTDIHIQEIGKSICSCWPNVGGGNLESCIQEKHYLSLLPNTPPEMCGLNQTDFLMLRFYTSNGFPCINSYLNNRPSIANPQTQLLIDTLQTTLTKFPNYEGIVGRSVRTLPELY